VSTASDNSKVSVPPRTTTPEARHDDSGERRSASRTRLSAKVGEREQSLSGSEAEPALVWRPSQPTVWTPEDYVFFGRYCETETIAATLQDIRTTLGHEAALLLAYRHRTLFHSLLLVSHSDLALQSTLQEAVVARPFLPNRETPAFAAYDPDRHDDAWLANALLPHPPFSDLASLFALPLSVKTRRPASRPGYSGSGLTPASIHVLLFGNAQHPGDPCLGTRLDDLVQMVNASAATVVHGTLAAEQDAEVVMDAIEKPRERKPFIRCGVSSGNSEEIDVPDAFLGAALRLTASSVGNLYFDSRDAKSLELEAAVNNANRIEEIAIDDRESVVAWVYRRRKPMIINDIRDYLRMHPGTGYRSVTDEELQPYAELAVPIVQSSFRPRGGNVIGVLNVEKAAPLDSGYYTYRDLAILRLAANRLSLWRAHTLLSEFSRSLAQLTRRNALSSKGATSEESERAGTGVPADAWGATPIVDEVLANVYALTRSYSACVRLLTPDRQHLVRFCAHPPERMQDGNRTLAVRNAESVNAWVARNGAVCYLANTNGDNAFAGYPGLHGYVETHGDTRAELCLPVFVAGRVVGTLNLESKYRDGYADARDLAAAVVEQVGLALQHARRAQEQTVFSMTIATCANVHELLHQADEIKELCDGRQDLLAIAENITRLVDVRSEPAVGGRHTTEEILQRALDSLGYSHIFHARNEPAIRLRHADVEALMLQLIFEELLRNAYTAAHKVTLRGSYAWHAAHLGGRRYLSVTIANPIRRSVAPEKKEALYRVPVVYDKDRRHIGAFTAGALARFLGGELYIISGEPPLFIAGLDLPADPEDQPQAAKAAANGQTKGHENADI
jgi:GAF domain-containing protein